MRVDLRTGGGRKCSGLVAAVAFYFVFLVVPTCVAQFVAVGGGVVLSQDRSGAPAAGIIGTVASADFSRGNLVAVDAGGNFLPFVGAGVHYSYSKPGLFLRRGDAFGSSADLELPTHTVTIDLRARTPSISGFRIYGLAGGGVSYFNLNVRRQVEVPFPGGAPSNLTAPVFTYGGGMEKSVAPLLRLKFEVRDYVTPIPERLFAAGGSWHRVAVIGGVVLGR